MKTKQSLISIIKKVLTISTFFYVKKGNEYWYARELMLALEYKRWDKFNNVINNAKTACEKSSYMIEDHFSQVGKMVGIGSKTLRKITDYKLNTNKICYNLINKV